MSMVQGIVKNHNGFIDVISAPGAGTTFTLYFPAVKGEEEAIRETIAAERTREHTILLVDDEHNLREMISEYLCDMGYAVHQAADGNEAMDLFRTHCDSIDLVITDLGMPLMDGEELFKELKKIKPDAKIIVSSGYIDGDTTECLLQKGFTSVLNKPASLEDIHKAVCTALKSN